MILPVLETPQIDLTNTNGKRETGRDDLIYLQSNRSEIEENERQAAERTENEKERKKRENMKCLLAKPLRPQTSPISSCLTADHWALSLFLLPTTHSLPGSRDTAADAHTRVTGLASAGKPPNGEANQSFQNVSLRTLSRRVGCRRRLSMYATGNSSWRNSR